ncbi:DUF4438 domain-containing protein [Acidobacteriota bacterium]
MNLSRYTKVYGVILLLIVVFIAVPLAQAEDGSKPVKALEYNKEQLVKQAAVGQIAEPGFGDPPYRIDPDGKLHVLPGTGSITFNFRSGDSAVNIAGDHVEPAVTLYNLGRSNSRSSSESRGLNTLTCIGNKVKIISGEAKGAEGWVIGKHGGAEHVMVDFPSDEVFEKLVIGDKMQVYTIGVGLELKNIKAVSAMNLSPFLLEALTKAGMGITDKGKLRIPVALRVPAKIMGSGLGRNHVYRGDYDIQLFDEKTVKEYNLDKLRFGDLVAIIDADNTYGRIFRTGAISIGVISHSACRTAGHGPGVTTLFTSPSGNFELIEDSNANLAKLLNIR